MSAKSGKVQLKPLLEKVLTDFPPVKRVANDPVQFPRELFEQGRSSAEIEASALLAAMLAYGSAKQFIKKIDEIMTACKWKYLDLIQNRTSINWPAYRLSTAEEIKTLALASGNIITRHGSLKKIFLRGYRKGSIKEGLIELNLELNRECTAIAGKISRGLRHLLPDPDSGGCAKRWHMFLRWMVRQDDGVDMHLWSEVNPAQLLIPLDRHISRIARNLGLTSRKADDWKTAEEISASLRQFDPDDPIKYDFSLCHLGIGGQCTHGKNPELCTGCLLKTACSAFRGK
ncbi:MAG: TIGR02757 family protein [Candidatus Riflebacteria bacterium]